MKINRDDEVKQQKEPVSFIRIGFKVSADGDLVPVDRAAALRFSHSVDELAKRMELWRREHGTVTHELELE